MSDLIERQAAIEYFMINTNWHDEEGHTIDDWDEKRKLLEDYFNGVPPAQPEPKWIPCSEQLPRQGQEVICQCRADMIKVLKLDAYGDWYQDAEHCYMGGFVIAWMPLPEPYKVIRNE